MTDVTAEDSNGPGERRHGLDEVDEQLIAGWPPEPERQRQIVRDELTDHLGYDRQDPAGRDRGNCRNGHRSKTVLTDVGPVEVDVPRDRDASFEPKIVAKRQRRLGRGGRAGHLAVGEGPDHWRGAGAPGRGLRRPGVAADDLHDHRKVVEGMAEWQNRPLDPA